MTLSWNVPSSKELGEMAVFANGYYFDSEDLQYLNIETMSWNYIVWIKSELCNSVGLLGWTKWWSSPALIPRFSFFVKDSSSSLSSSPPRSSSAKSTSSARQEDEDLAKGTYTLYLYLDKRCCFWLLTIDTNIFPFLMIQRLQLSSKLYDKNYR